MFLQDLKTFYADKPGHITPGGTKGQLLTFAELISSGLDGVRYKNFQKQVKPVHGNETQTRKAIDKLT